MIKSKTISIFNLIKNKYLFIQIVKTNNFLFKTGVISIFMEIRRLLYRSGKMKMTTAN